MDYTPEKDDIINQLMFKSQKLLDIWNLINPNLDLEYTILKKNSSIFFLVFLSDFLKNHHRNHHHNSDTQTDQKFFDYIRPSRQ